jgi:hypothetical protein
VACARKLAPAAFAVVAALSSVAAASATSTYSDSFSGTEIVPISSVRGTFVGVARGGLAAVWRTQIVHRPLSTGTTVAVTGGTFSIVGVSGTKLTGPVTGGSVTVTNRGSNCSNQTYRVSVTFGGGSFDGTLTHYRRSILGRCVVYAATIAGRGVFRA